MDVKGATTEYRLSQWAKIIQARHESGQTVKDFCLTNGISRDSYFYWQRKLREAACTTLTESEMSKDIIPGGWMQLSPKQVYSAKGTLDIEINGCNITVNAETNLELLKQVCRVLMSL
jgi:putative transposase